MTKIKQVYCTACGKPWCLIPAATGELYECPNPDHHYTKGTYRKPRINKGKE